MLIPNCRNVEKTTSSRRSKLLPVLTKPRRMNLVDEHIRGLTLFFYLPLLFICLFHLHIFSNHMFVENCVRNFTRFGSMGRTVSEIPGLQLLCISEMRNFVPNIEPPATTWFLLKISWRVDCFPWPSTATSWRNIWISTRLVCRRAQNDDNITKIHKRTPTPTPRGLVNQSSKFVPDA